MCGITGWINFDPAKPVDIQILKRMNDSLTHRGPDDEGFFLHENVGLAHKRLSIIDTSPLGRQPLFNEDKTVSALINGEIYNYEQLKAELQREGHVFKTKTDSEVVVHAYEKWGRDFLHQLDGMFSLALYDMRQNELFLAKDPFGKKPLYYTSINEAFYFSSELTAFFNIPRFKKVISRQSLIKYLAYDYVPAPLSILENCWKLPAGSFLSVSTKNPKNPPAPKKYWTPTYEPKLKISEPDAISEFSRLLQGAVKKRLMSDVPFGLFLSGGNDSGMILSCLSRLLPSEEINTFTIGFEEKSFDESKFAARVANHFGTRHHEYLLSEKDALGFLSNGLNQLDEPFADPSIIPSYFLCKYAKPEFTVALGGDGGDELLAGYDPFIAHKFSAIFDALPAKAVTILRFIQKAIKVSDENMSLGFKTKFLLNGLQDYAKGIPELRNNLWMSSFTPEKQQELFYDSSGLNLNFDSVYLQTLEQIKSSSAVKNTDRVIDNFINFYLQDGILYKMDRAGMLNSLEVRLPFLDKALAKFVNQLPVKYKMKGLTRKYLLKKSLQKMIPSNLIKRKKKGFGIPVSKWLGGPLKELLQETVVSKNLKETGVFDAKCLDQLVNSHLRGLQDNRKELWSLLILELWRRNNEVSWYP